MKPLILSDETLRRETSLGFREKLEIARLLDRLRADTVELPAVRPGREDLLLNKTIASELRHASLCAAVGASPDAVPPVWESIRGAKKPVLQVALPTSTVCMEYAYHLKAESMLEKIREMVTACKATGAQVEFSAEDATRAEEPFLFQALEAAAEAGATRFAVCDSAGWMMPPEFGAFVRRIRENVPGVQDAQLFVEVNGELHMATACAVEALKAGADGVKTVIQGTSTVVLEKLAEALSRRGEYAGVSLSLVTTELHRAAHLIRQIVNTPKGEGVAYHAQPQEREDVLLTAGDDITAVLTAVKRLGYDLTEEDNLKVYHAWKSAAEKKADIGARELEAIVATAALQVPETYRLVSFVINSGNIVASTAHVVLEKDGQNRSGVSAGDGPIDAAFMAIEQILGRHFELDDFQIQAVTEGREAMGSTLVKLRSDGGLYPGRGLSTDIIGASIQAYLNALNKIVYEEENR